ncbi:DNA primase [Patescibacteria group bacterium]|nr:DNA primase [Patescibacteria group bacterium]
MVNSPIDEIKNRLDIVEVIRGYIRLQKAGANYRAICPFHSEKKPSFFVSPTRQIWHCFGCSGGGDMFKFVMQIEGIEFGDALRTLAQKAGVELKRQDPKLKTERQRLYEISELSCRFFEKQLEESSVGKETKKYLLGRGMKEETIKKWRLGYSPDIWDGLSNFLVSQGYKREEIEKGGMALKSEKTGNYYDRFRGRIIFPIFDLNSQVVGFGGRIFKQTQRPDNQEEAKYINTPGTFLYDKSRILYGLNKAGIEIRRKNACILVEGYIDAIMANQAGFENVGATSGTALTPYQLKILKRYSDNILTAFDMDVAGDSATKRGIDLAQTQGFNIKVVTMPAETDPAEIISKNPDDWRSLIEKAKSNHDFYFENTLAKFDKNTLSGKKEISKILLPVIKKISNRIEQTVWIRDLAENLGVKEEDILAELQKIKAEQTETGTGDFIEKAIQFSQKTRKELLEERLALLIIKSPENLNRLVEADFCLFSSQTVKVINYFKENKPPFIKNLPDELAAQINCFLFKAEIEEVDVETGKEFESCLMGIKNLVVRNKLDEISKEIKKAEEEKDSGRVQKLLQEFNEHSKSRSDLEIA